jgi:hypothetical protein
MIGMKLGDQRRICWSAGLQWRLEAPELVFYTSRPGRAEQMRGLKWQKKQTLSEGMRSVSMSAEQPCRMIGRSARERVAWASERI